MTVLTKVMYLSLKVTQGPHGTIVTKMSFLHSWIFCAMMNSSGGVAGGGTVGISIGTVTVGISSSEREVTGSPDTPESIST